MSLGAQVVVHFIKDTRHDRLDKNLSFAKNP